MAVSGKVTFKKVSKNSFVVFLDSVSFEARKFIKTGLNNVANENTLIGLKNFSLQDPLNVMYDLSDLNGLVKIAETATKITATFDKGVLRKFSKKYAKGNIDVENDAPLPEEPDLLENFFRGFVDKGSEWLSKSKSHLFSKFSISEIKK